MSAGRYLPEGLVEGCRLKRAIAQDRCSRTTTSSCPPGRLADALRAEQYRHFRGETWLEDHLRDKGDAGPAPVMSLAGGRRPPASAHSQL